MDSQTQPAGASDAAIAAFNDLANSVWPNPPEAMGSICISSEVFSLQQKVFIREFAKALTSKAEGAEQFKAAGAPLAQQPLHDPANITGVATGSRNGSASESVTQGNLPPLSTTPPAQVAGSGMGDLIDRLCFEAAALIATKGRVPESSDVSLLREAAVALAALAAQPIGCKICGHSMDRHQCPPIGTEEDAYEYHQRQDIAAQPAPVVGGHCHVVHSEDYELGFKAGMKFESEQSLLTSPAAAVVGDGYVIHTEYGDLACSLAVSVAWEKLVMALSARPAVEGGDHG